MKTQGRYLTILIFLLLSQYACGTEFLSHVHEVLNRALAAWPDDTTSKSRKCSSHCGYPDMLPETVLSVSYPKTGSYDWKTYYVSSGNDRNNELIAKKINYYESGDVSLIFWLNKNNEIIRFFKKIHNTSLIQKPEANTELVFTAFLVYDKKGNFLEISPTMVLINDDRQEADFANFRIDNDGEIKDIESGDFDYYQLGR